MFDNFPPGIANDPSAPWNETTVELTEWSEAKRTVCVCCESMAACDLEDTCEECFVPEEVDQSDGDDDYDWEDHR